LYSLSIHNKTYLKVKQNKIIKILDLEKNLLFFPPRGFESKTLKENGISKLVL
jgi:hypothetical protein